MYQWLIDHWKDLAVALLAIDAALERIFPNSAALKKIEQVLSQVAPKA